MKTGKKLMSLLLVLVLVACMSAGALATETPNPGIITISPAIKGEQYSVYKLFGLTYVVPEEGSTAPSSVAYFYERTDSEGNANPWNEFFDNAAQGGKYIKISENGSVYWNDNSIDRTEANVAEFAKLALAYAKASEAIAPTATEPAIQTEGMDRAEAYFTNLELGYYLIDSSLGTFCGLTSADPQAIIREKNSVPSVIKSVYNSELRGWTWYSDASIGDTVEYKTDIIVGDGMVNYILYDTMDPGLTFAGSVSVKYQIASRDASGQLVRDDTGNVVYGDETVIELDTVKPQYILTDASMNETVDYTFSVEFVDENIGQYNLRNGDKLIVYYNATLNSNATVGSASNDNRTKMTYGEKTGADISTTEEDYTSTYTWQFNVRKLNSTKSPLGGATFKLCKDDAGTQVMYFDAPTASQPAAEAAVNPPVYRYNASGAVSEITTDATYNGEFVLAGLDSGTYYLFETAAPAGYNLLNGPVTITISSTDSSATGTASVEPTVTVSFNEGDTVAVAQGVVIIENASGTPLPMTGGIGTTFFYIVGAVLVLGAAVILVVRRRMSVEK